MTITELGTRLRKREISCLELVQEMNRALPDRFNAFITQTPGEAIEQAKALDADFVKGADRGPFHGIPIAHKDLFYTRGIKTTAGSPLFKDFVPDYNGDVVQNLENAGAICLGKTNLHELAYGVTSNNPHYGPVLNPHDTDRIPGGSSGGSAALVAAGLIPMATGTDSGGSIRIPASYCGIVGLKPTYDLLSRRGILPLNYGLDHAGPLTATVEDCALAMNAMSAGGADFNLAPLLNLDSIRFGIPKTFFFDNIHPEVEKVVRGRLDSLRITEVDLPDFNEVNACARVVQMAEAAALYINYEDPSLFGKDVWANIEDGRQILAHEYVNAQRLRAIFRRQMNEIWSKVDVIATPTTAITAPLRNALTVDINGYPEDVRLASTRLVRGWNYLGEPAISIPCGQDSLGLPVGMQLIAAPYQDARLMQIARTLAEA